MKITMLLVMVSLVCPALASADNTNLKTFFSATVGEFRGEGSTKVTQNFGKLSENHYSVDYTTVDSENDTWNVTLETVGAEDNMHTVSHVTYAVSGDNLYVQPEYGVSIPVQVIESTPAGVVYKATQINPSSGVPVDTVVHLTIENRHLTSSAISTINGVTVYDAEFTADY